MKKIIFFLFLVLAVILLKIYWQSDNNKIQGHSIGIQSIADMARLQEKKLDNSYVIGEDRLQEIKKEFLDKILNNNYDSLQFTVYQDGTLQENRISGTAFQRGRGKLFVVNVNDGQGRFVGNKQEQLINLHAGFLDKKLLTVIAEISEENYQRFRVAQIWLSSDRKKVFIFSGERGETKKIDLKSGQIDNLGPFSRPEGKILLEKRDADI